MKKNSKLGFSLIELSVVILIIGILVIGISKGSRIISEAKLKSARALTRSSVVNAIPDLGLWLDATDSDTIATGTIASNSYGSASDNSDVVSWKDKNSQLISNTIATAPADANRPKYIAKSTNGLPAIRFNGTNSYFVGSGGLNYRKMTIVIVSKLIDPNNNCGSLIYTYGIYQAGSLHVPVHCSLANMVQVSINGNADFINTNKSVVDNKPHIITIRDDNSSFIDILIDGANRAAAGGFTSTKNLTAFTIGAWDQAGGGVSRYLIGDISEMIIFSRNLNEVERKGVESYLSQKYSIKLN